MRLIDADVLKESIRKALVIRFFKYLLPSERIIINKIDNAQTVSDWISVKDRLPEEGQTVMCFWRWHDRAATGTDIQIVEYTDGRWYDYEYGYLDKEGYSEITHWMPLPEPPKEGEAG